MFILPNFTQIQIFKYKYGKDYAQAIFKHVRVFSMHWINNNRNEFKTKLVGKQLPFFLHVFQISPRQCRSFDRSGKVTDGANIHVFNILRLFQLPMFLSSPFISRWHDTVCTVPPSTRSIWSESTSGTTWSLETWAGDDILTPWHPDLDFCRLETLLRHAHFSLQSRRFWRQFDTEASCKNLEKHLCWHFNISDERHWNWAKELEASLAGWQGGWQGHDCRLHPRHLYHDCHHYHCHYPLRYMFAWSSTGGASSTFPRWRVWKTLINWFFSKQSSPLTRAAWVEEKSRQSWSCLVGHLQVTELCF